MPGASTEQAGSGRPASTPHSRIDDRSQPLAGGDVMLRGDSAPGELILHAAGVGGANERSARSGGVVRLEGCVLQRRDCDRLPS